MFQVAEGIKGVHILGVVQSKTHWKICLKSAQSILRADMY